MFHRPFLRNAEQFCGTVHIRLRRNHEHVSEDVSTEAKTSSRHKWTQFNNRPPNLDPEATSIFLFPGQGAQFVGMGKQLIRIPKVREMFECANEMLRTNLLKTCLEGPPEKLNQTIHCQPATYIISLAAVSKVQEENPDAIEFIEQNATQFRLRRVKRLPVSGAFHTPWMKPAAKSLSNALSRLETVNVPSIPVLSAFDLLPYRSTDNVRRKIVSQLVRPVLWEQVLQALYERPPDTPFPSTFEMGPGKQLGAMLRMVNRKAYARYNASDV